MSVGFYLIQPDNKLVEMAEQLYDSEELLQKWLAQYPNLLAGQQINSAQPRQWLLIAREMALPSEEDGAGRWSVDHLFLDQDAIPTIVEVKRSTDTRIRREVVGQMLDYAANAVMYWSVENLRSRYELACEKDGVEPAQRLVEALNVSDEEQFWQSARTNLQAGRVRMLFVADVIPPELQRVVEFLNQQMNPAEVLAIEVKRYVGQGVEAINAVVPRVIGQTAQAQGTKGASSLDSNQWDEKSFFEALQKRRGDSDVKCAREIVTWAKSRGLWIWWGKGKKDGSFFPMLDYKDKRFWTISVWTNGRVEIQFEMMKNRPVFDEEQKRIDLLNRVNKALQTSFSQEAINRRPSVSLSEPAKMSALLAIMDSYLNELKAVY
jgi:hypothetical protein